MELEETRTARTGYIRMRISRDEPVTVTVTVMVTKGTVTATTTATLAATVTLKLAAAEDSCEDNAARCIVWPFSWL